MITRRGLFAALAGLGLAPLLPRPAAATPSNTITVTLPAAEVERITAQIKAEIEASLRYGRLRQIVRSSTDGSSGNVRPRPRA